MHTLCYWSWLKRFLLSNRVADWVKTNKSATLDTLKNLCDVFIPATALGHTDLGPGTIGFLGTISSVIALMQIVDFQYRLSPSWCGAQTQSTPFLPLISHILTRSIFHAIIGSNFCINLETFNNAELRFCILIYNNLGGQIDILINKESLVLENQRSPAPWTHLCLDHLHSSFVFLPFL